MTLYQRGQRLVRLAERVRGIGVAGLGVVGLVALYGWLVRAGVVTGR